MDKRVDGLAGALREIAEQRDRRLRGGDAISAERFKQLQVFLAAELPVEMALYAAARQRDESLSSSGQAVPAVVRAALVEQVRSVRAAGNPLKALRQFVGRLRAHSPVAYRTAGVVAAAVVIAFAMLKFPRLNNATRRISDGPPPGSFINPAAAFSDDGIFDRSATALTLRMSRLELASLEPSLLTISRMRRDLEQADRVLPLDVAVRQIHLDVEPMRTP